MRFSIIMPCTLTPYKNCASNLEGKLIRAVESVLKQSFTDWELVIVADGCKRTKEVIMPYFMEYLPKIRLIEIPKQKIWSGLVRNSGIFKAEGDLITFLDVDDFFGENHLQIINDNIGKYDWVYYDHLTYNNQAKDFIPYNTNIDKMGMCGTSSVTYKRSMDVYWRDDSYKHDWVFICDLKRVSQNYAKIQQTEYTVCHVPNNNPKYSFDV